MSHDKSGCRVVLQLLFPLGQVVMTPGVHELVQAGRLDPLAWLARHAAGDWGDLCASDRDVNDRALKLGERLMSEYRVTPQLKLWIITEWDRSATTLLLPSEY